MIEDGIDFGGRPAPVRAAAPDNRPGVLLHDPAGGWFAAISGGEEVALEGAGDLSPLPRGLWLTDMPYEEVRAITSRGHILKRADWMKPGMGQILRAWGAERLPRSGAARMAAAVVSRALRLMAETLLEEPHLKLDEESVRTILSHGASLTTAVTQANWLRLSSSMPADRDIADRLQKSHLPGISLPDWARPRTGLRRLHFHLPKLAHALQVTHAPVPAPAIWRVGQPPEGVDTRAFIESTIRGSRRPMVVEAEVSVDPGRTPEWLDTFVNGRRGLNQRYRFAREEILAIHDRGLPIQVKSLVVGDGWQPSGTGSLLATLVEVAGGPQSAAPSLTVNMLAENILASAFRKPKGEADLVCTEGLWVAARDRTAMLPYVAALCDAGAVLVSALTGSLAVDVPGDPEILVGVLLAAWERGLHLDFETAAELEAEGTHVPVHQSSYGGSPVNYLVAGASHLRKRPALWRADEILDRPRAERARTPAPTRS